MLTLFNRLLIHNQLNSIFNRNNKENLEYIYYIYKYEKKYIIDLFKNKYYKIFDNNVNAVYDEFIKNIHNLRNDILQKFIYDFIEIIKNMPLYSSLLNKEKDIKHINIYAYKNINLVNWNDNEIQNFIIKNSIIKINTLYDAVMNIRLKKQILGPHYELLCNLLYNYDYKDVRYSSSIILDLIRNIKILQINNEYILADNDFYDKLVSIHNNDKLFNFNKNNLCKFIVEYNYYNNENQLIDFEFSYDNFSEKEDVYNNIINFIKDDNNFDFDGEILNLYNY